MDAHLSQILGATRVTFRLKSVMQRMSVDGTAAYAEWWSRKECCIRGVSPAKFSCRMGSSKKCKRLQ